MSYSLSLSHTLAVSFILLSLMKAFCIFLAQEHSVDNVASLDIIDQDILPPKHRSQPMFIQDAPSLCHCHLLFHFLLHNLVTTLYSLVMLLQFSFFMILVLIFLILTIQLLFKLVNALVLLFFCLILSFILIFI